MDAVIVPLLQVLNHKNHNQKLKVNSARALHSLYKEN